MIELTMERYGQALVDQTAQFAETARRAAVDAPVPTCPEWTLSQLGEHLGQTQHWVASIVEKRVSDPSQLPASFAALPADQDAWASWLTEGASLLAAACADVGADAPVWNPAGDARSGTRFWLRRILCETIIHRADAAATAGVAYGLDAELAADAITDHLAMMTSPGWAAQRRTPPRRFAAGGRPCTCTPATSRVSASGSSNAALRERRGSIAMARQTSRSVGRRPRCCWC
jgi:uncharacterized protein (TIGR03083 family)